MAGDPEGGLGLGADAQEQSPHPAEEEPRLERPEDGAAVFPDGLDPLPERRSLPGDECARDDIAVPVQVFGGRVEDDIGAELDGPREDGRGEGAVDDEGGPGALGYLGRRGDIGDGDRGV